MNGPAIYQACARCTAKWFGPASVEQCPRCGATTLPPVQATPPFRVRGVLRRSVATLLASVLADHQVACLAEALGQNPPWSNNIARTLQQQIGSEFPQPVASDWWPSAGLATATPPQHATAPGSDIAGTFTAPFAHLLPAPAATKSRQPSPDCAPRLPVCHPFTPPRCRFQITVD
ncbi:hypothetical protein [Fuerstiella marisgermanici]|uniref:Uncharacterized protein n=1 Tax=Fuerstiella marisgermanici TaxID=1891926 RepID=A0A1P8WQM4_9PLAN|nr:hypothetical protein [Fuerstiella marisgermanici]APZ96361.1 hypothetical protein Fuma_06030 [Fuerstiella marisgermanici]